MAAKDLNAKPVLSTTGAAGRTTQTAAAAKTALQNKAQNAKTAKDQQAAQPETQQTTQPATTKATTTTKTNKAISNSVYGSAPFVNQVNPALQGMADPAVAAEDAKKEKAAAELAKTWTGYDTQFLRTDNDAKQMIDPALANPNSGIRGTTATPSSASGIGTNTDAQKSAEQIARKAQEYYQSRQTADAPTPTMVDPALVAPNSGIRTAVQTVTPATDKSVFGVPSAGTSNAGTPNAGISAAGAAGTSAIGDTMQTSAAEYRNVKQSPITQPTTGTVAMTGTGVGVPEAPDLKPILDAWRTAAEKSQQAQIDYATQKGIEELQRAQEDAQKQFKAAQEQISAEEAWNKDNQALYAEARGDKGGIGAAQYDSIMNTAAINRQQVREQQTQLATDTWRQIADLRAQGEYKKADAVLQIAQTYLSNLLELEQWAANYGLSAAQFAESIREWEANFEAQVANITGYYKGSATYAREKEQQSTLASAGSALLNAGIMPSSEQLTAMGLTSSDAQEMLKAKTVKSGSGSGKASVLGAEIAAVPTIAELFAAAQESGAGEAYITKERLKALGLSDYDASALQKQYADWKMTNKESAYINPAVEVSDTAKAILQWAKSPNGGAGISRENLAHAIFSFADGGGAYAYKDGRKYSAEINLNDRNWLLQQLGFSV